MHRYKVGYSQLLMTGDGQSIMAELGIKNNGPHGRKAPSESGQRESDAVKNGGDWFSSGEGMLIAEKGVQQVQLSQGGISAYRQDPVRAEFAYCTLLLRT